MDLTIRVADDDAALLRVKAVAKGVSPEQYALRLLLADLAPEWLRRSWEAAKQAGVDRLSSAEIDAEIAEARRARRTTQS